MPVRTASAVPRCGSWRAVAARRGDRRLDGIGTMAGDDDRAGDTGIAERVEDMIDQGATGERMQHLGKAGTHASPLAGGQDDGRGGDQL